MTHVLVTRVGGRTVSSSPDGASRCRPAASTVTIDGVGPTAFSWDEPSGWAAAIDGIDAMYVVRPDRADAPDLVGALLAETSHRTRVVLLSERDADYTGPDGGATRAEHAVRDSGRAWTILRPNWFMQVFTDPRFYRDQVQQRGAAVLQRRRERGLDRRPGHRGRGRAGAARAARPVRCTSSPVRKPSRCRAPPRCSPVPSDIP